MLRRSIGLFLYVLWCFLCLWDGWRSKMAFFTGLAIGIVSCLGVQLRQLGPCFSFMWAPLWAFLGFLTVGWLDSNKYSIWKDRNWSSRKVRLLLLLYSVGQNRSYCQSEFPCQWEKWQDHIAKGYMKWEIILQSALELWKHSATVKKYVFYFTLYCFPSIPPPLPAYWKCNQITKMYQIRI